MQNPTARSCLRRASCQHCCLSFDRNRLPLCCALPRWHWLTLSPKACISAHGRIFLTMTCVCVCAHAFRHPSDCGLALQPILSAVLAMMRHPGCCPDGILLSTKILVTITSSGSRL